MTLREELAKIPGVVDADIDLRDGQPTAIRIHSSDGADRRAIGEAVQHALRRHGLRSRVAPPRRDLEPPSAPAPPHLSLMPAQPAGPGRPAAVPAARRLMRLSVDDDGRRATVRATDSIGNTTEERGRRHAEGQVAACVKAVARLYDETADPPELVAVRRWEHDQHRFVTVILDIDGSVRVGSAELEGLELRAVAVAVWQALSS